MAEHDAFDQEPPTSGSAGGEGHEQAGNAEAMAPAGAQAVLVTVQRFQSGANWFFWIAALSIVNSVILLSGSDWAFVVGLGITQVFDGIAHAIAQEAQGSATAIKAIGFGFDLVAAGVFAGFGVLARKQFTWAFVLGMALYGLDGLLFLLFGDLLSIAFHVFALFCIFNGMKALGELRRLAADASPPPQTQPAFPD